MAEKSWLELNAESLDLVLKDNHSEGERVKKYRQKKATSNQLKKLQQMTRRRKNKNKHITSSSKDGKFAPPVDIPISKPSECPRTHTHGDTPLTFIRDYTQKIFIRPRTKTKFDRQLECVKKIRELIETRFEGSWKSWRKFPLNVKGLIFLEFEKHYEWDPSDTKRIRNIFNTCAMSCVKNKIYQLRKLSKKPKGQEVFEGLIETNVEYEFKKQSVGNSKNQASNCNGQGFPLCTGGCVSRFEHIDKTAEQVYQPSIANAVMHLNADDSVQRVNKPMEKTFDKYTNELNQSSSQCSNGKADFSKQDQIKTFTEVVEGSKRDVTCELANQPYHVMHGSSSSVTSRWRVPIEWENERTELLSRINDIESSFEAKIEEAVLKKMNDIEARLEARFNAMVEEAIRVKVDDFEKRFMTSFMARFASFEENMRGLFSSSRSHQPLFIGQPPANQILHSPYLPLSHPSSFYLPSTDVDVITPRYLPPPPIIDHDGDNVQDNYNVNDMDDE